MSDQERNRLCLLYLVADIVSWNQDDEDKKVKSPKEFNAAPQRVFVVALLLLVSCA